MKRALGKVPPRRRRNAEEARKRILDAAESALDEHGPDALRLQELAKRLGISHPTVLHHFGSREALVKAVVRRAFEALQDDVLQTLGRADLDEQEVSDLIEHIFQVLSGRGHARLLAWLLLSGTAHPSDAGDHLAKFAEAVHARRSAETPRGKPKPALEDSVFSVLALALVLFGDAVAGEALRASAGLAGDKKAELRFREWFTRLVVGHMDPS
jgi:TetR/AcrR family transcriptional regulator, repressor for neighboring sulfatase